MTTTRKAAPKGAAARSGVNGRSKTITVQGTKILLKKALPLQTLKEMAAIVEAGDLAQLPDMIRALEVVLDDEQMERIWAIEVEPKNGSMIGPLQDVFGEVIEKVFTAYGIGPGE